VRVSWPTSSSLFCWLVPHLNLSQAQRGKAAGVVAAGLGQQHAKPACVLTSCVQHPPRHQPRTWDLLHVQMLWLMACL
jgi:hypothetical protein